MNDAVFKRLRARYEVAIEDPVTQTPELASASGVKETACDYPRFIRPGRKPGRPVCQGRLEFEHNNREDAIE